MIIETNRLIMRPFSLELINAALTHDKELYKEIGILPNDEWPEPDLKEAMDYFRSVIISNGITGFGSWIILNRNNEIVGSAGFLGEPLNGSVEIGFGIIPSKRRNGFCEESIRALIDWALRSTKVNTIIAHCNVDNIASYNLLKKCGFIQQNERNELIEWVYKNTPNNRFNLTAGTSPSAG